MTLDDLEHQNRGFYVFLAILGCETFQEQIAPKSIEIDMEKLRMKSFHLLLFTLVTTYIPLVTIGNGGSRRLACSAVRRQLSDTASQLVEVMVEDNVTAVDWLAIFSDYGVTTKLRESYDVVKSASKIQTRHF